LNHQALLKDQKDKTLLLQASIDDIQVDIPKMLKWEEIKLPEKWELTLEMPPTKIQITETENLNSIEQ
jgi:hypothetical protein